MTRLSAEGSVHLARYNGVLTVGVNPAGLYLAVMPLFRPGHPPLFIPWPDVTVGSEQRVVRCRERVQAVVRLGPRDAGGARQPRRGARRIAGDGEHARALAAHRPDLVGVAELPGSRAPLPRSAVNCSCRFGS